MSMLWQSVRIKHVASVNDNVLPENMDPDYEIRYVDISNVEGNAGIRSSERFVFGEAPSRARRLVEDRDVIVSTVRTYLRAIARIEEPPPDLVVSTGFAVLRPGRGIDSRFFGYAMQSEQTISEVVAHSVGVSYPAITASDLVRIKISVPEKPLQVAIADFLDRETAEADAVIGNYERLLELLEEKRIALINHAVTKGLDPNAPMKDSGKEWIGKVPRHWQTGTLRRFARRVVVGIAEAATHAYSDEGIPILRSTNIRANEIVGDIYHILPGFSEGRGTKRIDAGDLVTVRTGAPGVTAVVPLELDGCQCFTMLITTLRNGHVPAFFSYALNSRYGRDYFSLESWGSAQLNISVPILQDAYLAVPPKAEQQLIAQYLDKLSADINATARRIKAAIDLTRERRSSLIDAAVTGQVDVTTYKSNLAKEIA